MARQLTWPLTSELVYIILKLGEILSLQLTGWWAPNLSYQNVVVVKIPDRPPNML